MGPKFNYGDLVWIRKYEGEFILPSDCEAIVTEASGNNRVSYMLHVKGRGESAWHNEEDLTLIAEGQLDRLKQWKAEEDEEERQKSDLDWIFAHGREVLANPHGASIAALACCLGIDNLWGSRGEGITYFENTHFTLQVARPFLEVGDKEGWLAECDVWKLRTQAKKRCEDANPRCC
ncbi:MAG: hypothetical protein ACNA7J_14075 [Wenzhouxiangella sp.]